MLVLLIYVDVIPLSLVSRCRILTRTHGSVCCAVAEDAVATVFSSEGGSVRSAVVEAEDVLLPLGGRLDPTRPDTVCTVSTSSGSISFILTLLRQKSVTACRRLPCDGSDRPLVRKLLHRV